MYFKSKHEEEFRNKSLNINPKIKKDYQNQIFEIEGIDKFLGLSLTKIAKIFGVSDNVSTVTRELSKEFIKNSNFRSIRRSFNGTIKEAIPLNNINFETIVEENFQDSELHKRFEDGFYFLVYQESKIKETPLILEYAFLWKPDSIFIENCVYPFWLKVKGKTKNGIRIKQVKRGRMVVNKNNLPKTKDSLVLHVRPKAKNANDTTLLPDGRKITKQAYWINSKFLKNLIDSENIEKSRNNHYKNNIDFNDFIRESKTNVTYSLEYYKKRLKKHSVLEVIYSKTDYIKEKEKHKHDKELYDILKDDYTMKYDNYINKQFNSIKEALNYDILELDYLDKENYKYRNYSVFNGVFYELKSNLQIIEIDKNIFITSKNLKRGGINKKEINNFINEIISFAKSEKPYFNVQILKDYKIGHKVSHLGFQDLFYEELLKNSSKFKYQTFKGNVIFTICDVEVSVFSDILINYVLAWKEVYRYEIREMFENEFKIKNFDSTDILNIYNSNDDIYYCPHMDMFFKDEARYLNIILRRNKDGIIK